MDPIAMLIQTLGEEPLGQQKPVTEPTSSYSQEYTPNLDRFARAIKSIETPDDVYGEGFQRTQTSPARHKKLYGESYAGSTAFGPHQITKKLIEEGFRKNLFKGSTKEDAKRLRRLGEVAAKIGGSDRVKFEEGGEKRGIALKLAKELGFESPDNMLESLDYGGDFGTSKDPSLKDSYNKVANILLQDVLDKTQGNLEEAALMWHGGDNSTDIGKQKNEEYLKKFRNTLNKIK